MAEPSSWVTRWAALIRPGGTVLDLACGSGRHLCWLAAQGFVVTGVDRDMAAVAGMQALAEIIVADIEQGPWPLEGRRFDAIVVTNYLWRPLWPQILKALQPGGLWLHETFASGHELIGKPSRPAFLLRPGELLQVAHGLRVVAYEDGVEAPAASGAARCVQRIAALKLPAAAPTLPGGSRGGGR